MLKRLIKTLKAETLMFRHQGSPSGTANLTLVAHPQMCRALDFDVPAPRLKLPALGRRLVDRATKPAR